MPCATHLLDTIFADVPPKYNVHGCATTKSSQDESTRQMRHPLDPGTLWPNQRQLSFLRQRPFLLRFSDMFLFSLKAEFLTLTHEFSEHQSLSWLFFFQKLTFRFLCSILQRFSEKPSFTSADDVYCARFGPHALQVYKAVRAL